MKAIRVFEVEEVKLTGVLLMDLILPGIGGRFYVEAYEVRADSFAVEG